MEDVQECESSFCVCCCPLDVQSSISLFYLSICSLESSRTLQTSDWFNLDSLVCTLPLGTLISIPVEVSGGLTLFSCGLAVHARLRLISSKQGAWKMSPSIVPMIVFNVIVPQANITIPERIVPRMLKKSESKVSPRDRVRRE